VILEAEKLKIEIDCLQNLLDDFDFLFTSYGFMRIKTEINRKKIELQKINDMYNWYD